MDRGACTGPVEGYSPWGHKDSDMTEWISTLTIHYWRWKSGVYSLKRASGWDDWRICPRCRRRGCDGERGEAVTLPGSWQPREEPGGKGLSTCPLDQAWVPRQPCRDCSWASWLFLGGTRSPGPGRSFCRDLHGSWLTSAYTGHLREHPQPPDSENHRLCLVFCPLHLSPQYTPGTSPIPMFTAFFPREKASTRWQLCLCLACSRCSEYLFTCNFWWNCFTVVLVRV